MGLAGVAAEGDVGSHCREDFGGLLDARPGYPGVGVAAGEEGWRAGEIAGVGEIAAGRADEAAGPGDEASVTGGMRGEELRGETGSLREAGEDDALARNAGGESEINDGLDTG